MQNVTRAQDGVKLSILYNRDFTAVQRIFLQFPTEKSHNLFTIHNWRAPLMAFTIKFKKKVEH